MNASFAPAARPLAHLSGGTLISLIGPAGLLQAYRFLADSRDTDTGRTPSESRRSVQRFSLPGHHELCQRMPERAQPRGPSARSERY